MINKGLVAYGNVTLTTANRARWDAQVPDGTWSDDGELAECGCPGQKAQDVLEHNVHLGVSEHIAEATGHLSVLNGELKVALNIKNDTHNFYALIPLQALVSSAIEEIRPRLGVDQNGQAVLSQLLSLGRSLATITQKQKD